MSKLSIFLGWEENVEYQPEDWIFELKVVGEELKMWDEGEWTTYAFTYSDIEPLRSASKIDSEEFYLRYKFSNLNNKYLKRSLTNPDNFNISKFIFDSDRWQAKFSRKDILGIMDLGMSLSNFEEVPAEEIDGTED